MNHRRSHLEMLVCALLVAALAVQPAIGDGKGEHSRAPVANAAAGATAGKQSNLLASAKAPARAKAPAKAKRRAAVRAAQDPAVPPTQSAPPVTVPPGETGPGNGNGNGNGASPVDVVVSAPPEQGDPDGPPVATPPVAAPPVAPVPPVTRPEVPAAEEAGADRPTVSIPDTARGGSGNSASTPATPTTSESAPQATALAVPSSATPATPDTQEPSSGAVPKPQAGSGAARRPSTTSRPNGGASPASRAPQATSTGNGAATGAAATGTIPTALGTPLLTPATEGITRVRPGAGGATSRPRPSVGDTIPSLDGVADSGASDSSVGAVLVSWAKYALAVLGLLVLVLGANAVLATARARRLERQRERLMEDIGLLQAALLPAVPSRLGALLTTVAYRPADGPAAGGDFYDAFALPDGRVGLLLGDVSGHGRQALAKTTLVRFTVRAHLEAGLSPREAIAISGRSLDGRLSDDFATVIAAIHDPVKGTLTYASAGHPPPIIVGPPSHRSVTVSSAPPIGVGFPTGQRQTILPMPEGTSVMIYSDGLLEARIDGVPLGPDRLAAWLGELGPEATAKAILDRVVSQADRVPDDLAAVLLHAAPGAPAPAARIEQLKLDVLDMDGPDLDGFLVAAGVSEVDRLIAGRRVSELLATTSGVIVDVRTGEHPMVSVAPIGDDSGLSVRPSARVR
jgi:serine phosphatase RsbU (regulator of sigma subunit)